MNQTEVVTATQALAAEGAEKGIKALLSKISGLIRKAKPSAYMLVAAFLLTVKYIKELKAIFELPEETTVSPKAVKVNTVAATVKAKPAA
tara:strand:+ start:607 stop:876 length:270 start_codon:yes stop_codon:yes gene_type:complete